MNRQKHVLLLAATALPVLLTGCAADTAGYPSLARRDAERIVATPQETTDSPPVQLPADRAILARLDTLVAQAKTAHDTFRSRRARAEALVRAAAGAPVASESWAVATVALADLESARSDAMVALADIDAIDVATRIEGTPATAMAVTAAHRNVIELVAEQDGILARLRGRMAG